MLARRQREKEERLRIVEVAKTTAARRRYEQTAAKAEEELQRLESLRKQAAQEENKLHLIRQQMETDRQLLAENELQQEKQRLARGNRRQQRRSPTNDGIGKAATRAASRNKAEADCKPKHGATDSRKKKCAVSRN